MVKGFNFHQTTTFKDPVEKKVLKTLLEKKKMLITGIFFVSDLLLSFERSVFVAFVKDNATMSSIPYFENCVSYFVQRKK